MKEYSNQESEIRRPSKSFRDLIVWQRAHQFTLEVYKATKYYLILSKDLSYPITDKLESLSEEVSKLLDAYIKSIRKDFIP